MTIVIDPEVLDQLKVKKSAITENPTDVDVTDTTPDVEVVGRAVPIVNNVSEGKYRYVAYRKLHTVVLGIPGKKTSECSFQHVCNPR